MLAGILPGGTKTELRGYCVVKSDYQVGPYAFSMPPVLKVEYDKYAG